LQTKLTAERPTAYRLAGERSERSTVSVSERFTAKPSDSVRERCIRAGVIARAVRRARSGRSGLDVLRRQIDHDQTLLAAGVQLHDDVGRIARHGFARAERSVDRVLQLETTAIDVVRDIDDLDLSTRRADEREPLRRRRE